MKRSKVIIQSIALVSVLALFSGCSLFPAEEDALAPPLVETSDVQYKTEAAVKGHIEETVEDTCSAVAVNTYNLSFEDHSGVLRELTAAVGDTVTKGQKLAVLDTGNVESQLEDAQINLQKQQLQLKQAQLNPPAADGVNYGAEILKLDIQQTQSNIAELQKEISSSTITSPINGIVTYVADAGIGDMMAARKTVVTVADSSALALEYSGSKAEKLKLGMDVKVTLNDKEYSGKISATKDSVPVDQKKDFDTKVRITATGMPAMTVGARAQFSVLTSAKDDVVIVPRSAVSGYADAFYVSIYKDGIKTERSVEIGIMTSDKVEIISGVTEGEQVVTGTQDSSGSSSSSSESSSSTAK